MAERRRQDDLAFGSDSFLDVVANIVGILIILIVVAGLRVSRAPVVQVAEPDADSTVAKAAPPVTEPAMPPTRLGPAALLPRDSQMSAAAVGPTEDTSPADPDPPQPLHVPGPEPEPTPPPELVAAADSLRASIGELRQRVDEARRRRESLQAAIAADRSELERLREELADAESVRASLHGRLRVQTAEREAAERRLAQLRSELETAEADRPAAEVLTHRVTPIGRVVSGPELHVRLADNHVSVVPVEKLAGELQQRIERNRDAIIRMHRYEGEVGPIEGYRMRYLMQRERGTPLEELRYGGGLIKMTVAFWELIPDNAVSESAAEALVPGSRFRRALQQAGPDATLTLWVYPDSFELHRALLEFAQSAGFDVAARPLPYGVPIAGSPNGSRSVAQ